MADTFGGVWKQVRLRCPMAPALLCADWVKNAYRTACERRAWSWLRAEAALLINDARSGTVTVIRNSPLVGGVGMVFVAADVDRQVRLPSGPPYTIIGVNIAANLATLDRPYGGTTASTTAQILDAYVTMPEDFGRFLAVLDPSNGWGLRFWITDDELNAWDPQRSSSGTPWALVSRRLASTVALAGRTQFELWPYATTARHYPYYYVRRSEVLNDESVFQGLLATRGDILLNGALAEAAEWPGMEDKKNPYFSLQIADRKREQFDHELHTLERNDEDVFPSWWDGRGLPLGGFGPVDSNFAQSHDV